METPITVYSKRQVTSRQTWFVLSENYIAVVAIRGVKSLFREAYSRRLSQVVYLTVDNFACSAMCDL